MNEFKSSLGNVMKYKKLYMDMIVTLIISYVVSIFFSDYYTTYMIVILCLTLLYFLIVFLCENEIIFVPGIGRTDGVKTPVYLYFRNFLTVAIPVAIPFITLLCD